jgi:RHS repeat-associated protein
VAENQYGVPRFLRVQKVVYPNGREVYYNHPSSGTIGAAMNRVDNIASSATPAAAAKFAAYSYLGASSIVKLDYPALDAAGGLGLSYDPAGDGSYSAFDRFGRVIDHGWRKTNGTAVDRFTYGYDRAGNRTYRKNTVASALGRHLDEKYSYDGLDRLTDANRGDYNASTGALTATSFHQLWNLSALGNWRGFKEDPNGCGSWLLDQTRAHNLVNELTGITGGGWPAPTYDAAGNMVSGPRGDTPTTRIWFKWDAWNRMVQVNTDSGGSPGGTIASYSYDGRNFRIAKAVANGGNWDRTDFYYNESWQVLEERKATGQAGAGTVATAVYCQYVWDLRYIDSPVCRSRDTTGNGTLDETLYYTNDVNFNVTALVDTAGAVQERYVYSPYGRPTIYDPAWDSVTSFTESNWWNEILYCGYRYDPETGMYHVRNRYLNPIMGRWTQREPWGDGRNLYEYCLSCPLEHVDDDGLDPKPTANTLQMWADYEKGWTTFYGRLAKEARDQGDTGRAEVFDTKGDEHWSTFQRYKQEIYELGKEEAQIIDKFRRLIQGAREHGWNHAADNLDYFLSGKGGVKQINWEWLRTFSEIRSAENTNKGRFESITITDAARGLKDGQTKEATTHWDREVHGSEELFYASGTSSLRSIGKFSLTRNGNAVAVTGFIDHYWWDTYHWTPGKAVVIPGFGKISDEDGLMLKANGKADDFFMESYWTQSMVGTIKCDSNDSVFTYDEPTEGSGGLSKSRAMEKGYGPGANPASRPSGGGRRR